MRVSPIFDDIVLVDVNAMWPKPVDKEHESFLRSKRRALRRTIRRYCVHVDNKFYVTSPYLADKLLCDLNDILGRQVPGGYEDISVTWYLFFVRDAAGSKSIYSSILQQFMTLLLDVLEDDQPVPDDVMKFVSLFNDKFSKLIDDLVKKIDATSLQGRKVQDLDIFSINSFEEKDDDI